MSGFSSVAEIIFGHAISEAKRHDREQAEALHLLSGIRRWQEEQFDQKFPGASTSILNALERLRGDSFKTPILEHALWVHDSEIAYPSDSSKSSSSLPLGPK